MAHRDYTHNGSVQVMLFADRLEVRNPGRLPPSLTLEKLRIAHTSVPGNPLLARSMYLAAYIEEMGTGTLDMIRQCIEADLPEPEFAVKDGFVATVPRSRIHTCTVAAYCGPEPLAGVDILALFPNGTWKRSQTDKHGEAHIELYTLQLPMTVFAAAEGYAACTKYGWQPAERVLSLQLDSLDDGGAVIFPQATGYIPGLRGRLNPIRDTRDRTYLYASNVAINNGQPQPVTFDFGEELHLTDADGNEAFVHVVDIVGRSALLEYRAIRAQSGLRPESQPESQPESLKSKVLSLLEAGPMSKAELSVNLGQKTISGQLNKVVRSLVAEGRIMYTLPDKPRSRLQKYRLTNKGRNAAARQKSENPQA